MVIYWNSKVNILIFWDTDFWLSWAVSANHQNYNKKKLLKCFTLHVMNLKYMKVSLFEMLQEKKNSRHSNLLRCTCIYILYIYIYNCYYVTVQYRHFNVTVFSVVVIFHTINVLLHFWSNKCSRDVFQKHLKILPTPKFFTVVYIHVLLMERYRWHTVVCVFAVPSLSVCMLSLHTLSPKYVSSMLLQLVFASHFWPQTHCLPFSFNFTDFLFTLDCILPDVSVCMGVCFCHFAASESEVIRRSQKGSAVERYC